MWRESLRAVVEVARKNVNAHLLCVCGRVLPGVGLQGSIGATEPPVLNRAAKGWMVERKVFSSSSVGSGRVIWLIRAVIAVFYDVLSKEI